MIFLKAPKIIIAFAMSTNILSASCGCSTQINNGINDIEEALIKESLNPSEKKTKELTSIAKDELKSIKAENKLIARYLKFYMDNSGLLYQNDKFAQTYGVFLEDIIDNNKEIIDE